MREYETAILYARVQMQKNLLHYNVYADQSSLISALVLKIRIHYITRNNVTEKRVASRLYILQ